MINTFSQKLKELRIEKGLKQSELALELKTTQRRISYLEQGKSEPDIETLCQISDYFGCTIDYLIGRED